MPGSPGANLRRHRSTGAVCAALSLVSCAATNRPFPLRAPLWRDPDLTDVTVRCRRAPSEKDPSHVSCAPEVEDATLIWDGLDNLLLRPAAESLGLPASGEAVDVNSVDEVPDSSWFTNRIGVAPLSADELALGACKPAQMLDGTTAAEGSWVIDKGKTSGSNDGFRVRVPGKGKYLFKADDADTPEHSSAAQAIGARVLYAAGYYTSCEQVVLFRPSVLRLTPGLTYRHNFGDARPFDARALEAVLGHSPRRGPFVRMVASAWLPGYDVGGFHFEGTRGDDPNDVVPHEDRRELRGLRLLAAWLDRHDTRSGNTVDMWIARGPGAPDASPGHVIHYQIDASETLGSTWNWAPDISVRLGRSYVVDWGDIATDFVTLGARTRPWDTLRPTPGEAFFGYFDVRDFDPEAWKNEYPIAAYSRMTERDGAWMARILARFTPENVVALAAAGRLSDERKTAYLASVLEGRLERILERYLTRLSPVTDVRVEESNRLCAVDLAERRRLRPADAFRYSARVVGGPWLDVERGAGGAICARLPLAVASEAAPRYARVRIEDGVAPGPLVAHLYDRGSVAGYTLAGVERPD